MVMQTLKSTELIETLLKNGLGKLKKMININDNNWDVIVSKSEFGQMKRAHKDSLIEWIKFHHGGFGLGLRVSEDDVIPETNHKSIKIYKHQLSEGSTYIAFFCEDSALKTIFNSLCKDLITFCLQHPEIIKPAHAIIQRAKAWEALFLKGPTGLGKQLTFGLFSELIFYRNYLLLKNYPISHWVGPSDSSQDFDINNFFVEVKHASDSGTIKVSSLEQLQSSLDMVLLTMNIAEEIDGLTIDELVQEINDQLPIKQQAIFQDKLLSVGYLVNKNYPEPLSVNEIKCYSITNTFPHLESNQIEGIIAANYTIDLKKAEHSRINLEYLNERL